jgi:hypothetical protein
MGMGFRDTYTYLGWATRRAATPAPVDQWSSPVYMYKIGVVSVVSQYMVYNYVYYCDTHTPTSSGRPPLRVTRLVPGAICVCGPSLAGVGLIGILV